LLLGERQAEGLVETLADGADADAESGGLLKGDVGGNLHGDVTFNDGVFPEGAVVGAGAGDTVDETRDAVAFLERLGDGGANGDDGTGVVTADCCIVLREVV
jgi:hypothetical protein